MTLKKLQSQLNQIKSLGNFRERIPASARSATTIVIKGRKLHDFTNWDLFGLSQDHSFKRSAQSTIEAHGISPGAARLISGSSKQHDLCEQRIANFFGFDDSLLFSSKNQVVLSLVTSLCGQSDLVLYDESMISPVADAAYLAEVSHIPFDINNLPTLEAELEKSNFYQGRYIFAESLSLQTGKAVEVSTLVALARKYQAVLFLDESYALGTRGIRGSGVSEVDRLEQELIGVFCDLSLASACYGATLCSSKVVCDLVLNSSRTFSSETALPNCLAAGVVSALDHLELQHSGREKIRRLSEYLTTSCKELGFTCLNDEGGPLVAIATENRQIAFAIAEGLFQKGFLVEATAPWKMRSDKASVRIVLRQAHSDDTTESLMKALAEIQTHLKL